ncbi:MAG: hypothetical protein E7371_04645 [Clostridiales bacterium]|nr:hypothetical protein [Clostridiales bacterium]
MENAGLKGLGLSYNQAMENVETKNNENDSTEEKGLENDGKLLLTATDIEEYYCYKKQKKIGEIMDALSKTEGVLGETDDVARAVERASRIRQVALRLTPTHFARSKGYFVHGKLAVDCCVGGDGEVLPQVKAYEMKVARKMGAKELTVALTPSLVDGCRYTELRREMKMMRRAAGKRVWKVWVDKQYPYTTLMRLARLASEAGADYFSVPYFAGCEQLRYELYRGCRLEILGVETLGELKKMTAAGVGRIVTARGYELYTQWMQEADKIRYIPPKKQSLTMETPTMQTQKNEMQEGDVQEEKIKESEEDYQARLEKTELFKYL